MDLRKLNAIAKGGSSRILKRVSDLQFNQIYLIEGVNKTNTKYGEKVTINLEGNIYCYLPVKVSEELLADEGSSLNELQENIQRFSIGIRRLEPRGRYNPIEFIMPQPENRDID